MELGEAGLPQQEAESRAEAESSLEMDGKTGEGGESLESSMFIHTERALVSKVINPYIAVALVSQSLPHCLRNS